jgi:hypothetical protein
MYKKITIISILIAVGMHLLSIVTLCNGETMQTASIDMPIITGFFPIHAISVCTMALF